MIETTTIHALHCTGCTAFDHTEPAPASKVEFLAQRVLLSVNACRNTLERTAFTWGTMKRGDVDQLRVGLDWALEQGLVQYGTSNASARAWSRGGSDELLYMTKAGKAWLRTRGAELVKVEMQMTCARLAFGEVAR